MKYWNKVIKKIFGLIFTLFSLYIAVKISVFYMPFLVALVIALLIEPLIKWLARKLNIERKYSAIIIMIIVFAIFIGIISIGTMTLITESSNLLGGLNGYLDKVYTTVNNLTETIRIDGLSNKKEVNDLVDSTTKNILDSISGIATGFLNSILNFVTSLPNMGICVAVTIIATYFLCADRFYILDQLEYHLPIEWAKKFGDFFREIVSSLGSYVKAELILIGIDFIIVLAWLIILNMFGFNINYPLLIALGIGFVDALPIVGSGTVIVPWAVISAFNGNIKLAIALILLYVAILILRQFLEPKIISSQIGIHPIFTLISMYTGFKVLGIAGMLVGPIILIILKTIFGKTLDRGFVKTIFDKR